MVVKTEICAFSEYRIYPGHGMKFIRKDGQPLSFHGSKSMLLYHQKKKSAKIRWTLAWRRLNKKGQKEEGSTGRKRRVQRIQRAIVGISIEEFKEKRSQKPSVREAAREAALKEIKERNAAKKEARKAEAAKKAEASKKAEGAKGKDDKGNKKGNKGGKP